MIVHLLCEANKVYFLSRKVYGLARPQDMAKLQRAMFYQTFICFCLSEAKRLCLNHCSWLLDDVEFVCHANKQKSLCYFFSINVS